MNCHLNENGTYTLNINRNWIDNSSFTFKEPFEITTKKSKKDTVELIIKSSQFYDYLLLNSKSNDWVIDTTKSTRFLSVNADYDFEFNILTDSVEIITKNNIVRVSIRSRGAYILHPPEDKFIPPLPPIEFYSIMQDIRNDSLWMVRRDKMKHLEEVIINNCSMETDNRVLFHFFVDAAGNLKKTKISTKPKNKKDSLELAHCIEQVVNIDSINVGSLEEIVQGARGGRPLAWGEFWILNKKPTHRK